jgi:hypothetical protein
MCGNPPYGVWYGVWVSVLKSTFDFVSFEIENQFDFEIENPLLT